MLWQQEKPFSIIKILFSQYKCLKYLTLLVMEIVTIIPIIIVIADRIYSFVQKIDFFQID
jgi:hypothetical protein